MEDKRIIFDEERCKGCGLCVEACPLNLIKLADRINSMGYHPAEVIKQNSCTGCANCALMCPDVVIKVYRPEKKEVKNG